MNIKIKKLHPDAQIPTYGTDGAAAFDLYALEDVQGIGFVSVRTGLAFEVPEGHAMIIKPRSGLAFNHRVQAFSGTIDSDYRGEVKVLLEKADSSFIYVERGDRIAQAIIIPIPRVTFTEVDELSITERGDGGFGHTGA